MNLKGARPHEQPRRNHHLQSWHIICSILLLMHEDGTQVNVNVFNVFIVFVLHDSNVLFYLLCIFNVNRAPWKSSIAILKGLYWKGYPV